MRHASGPAQPTLFTADACASVRRNRFLTPDLLTLFRQQRARVKRRLEAVPDAPRTRAAYDREYEFVETETSEPLTRRGRA